MDFQPRNILIIELGQLGDVILSLPALKAVREKFPSAKITAMIGRPSAELIEVSGFADEKIIVDRAELRRRNPIWSINQLLKLVADVRRRRFDLVIDLHSLYETNQLAFLSGAKRRLLANRESRSLDFLGNFEPRPPREDKSKHLTDRYLDVLKPLGIEDADRFVKIAPSAKDLATVETILQNRQLKNKILIGFFLGAGHPSRRWNLENFANLAALLSSNDALRVIVFLGPEETDLRAAVERKFPPQTIILEKLKLFEVAAAMSHLRVLISNDTGPMHLGAIVGAPIVLLLDERAPLTYIPLTEKISVVRSGTIDEITVAEVLRATQEILN